MSSPAAAVPRRGSRALAVLQRIGRSLMLPIAVLPAAGLLLRLGQPDVLGENKDAWISFSGSDRIAEVFAAAGGALFDWLPLLFAVGVAVGFAKKADGSTALAAVVGYLVFHYVSMNMFFHSEELRPRVVKALFDPDNPGTPNEVLDLGAGNPTQVLGGIAIGITAALLYQRYYRIKLPTWLAFFGGRRFVPIITAFAATVLGLLFGWIWPLLGGWLTDFGQWMERNSTLGAAVYGVVNRLLLPLGLHHIPNNVVWFQIPECTIGGKTYTGDLNCYLNGADGAGWSMAGYFPVLMFALPAAALAIWHAAPRHRRAAVGGIMFSAALTAFVTGITEPIEFAFIFVAPVLFIAHALLTGVAMALADVFGMKLGFSFSAGAIDMLINGGKDNTHNLAGLIVMGLIYAVVYYFLFSLLIRVMNIPTPGREPEGVESVAADPSASPEVAASAAPSPAQAESRSSDG
ncbi:MULTISPECIES: PTS transporter subunit EIIC [Thermomonospora]|uniref:Protein-N(Pi)-phosphohistidine--sugarphosphotran sferase n=1 Tax=Thermomonospora curvata (strain ATCC 19995 / DSM 43183 / JCM 3096 / KCTC 9072 / NBRC 15933 / NCIMB 10081 / Henssen B9) TaxID=471852 RepID=D1AF18_THECD|nr:MULTISPECIES: PTS transporter subunit EIIC [Thermomonospora]ACY99562.1 Protein-N(pi)-phosphohistidine--sugarphosphotran sferase [Thermomonospora curvata DSM 43183]PKK12599.1 MAG: PTS sugar transporter subunit IIA [Thermomonospora sp. CIF 1]